MQFPSFLTATFDTPITLTSVDGGPVTCTDTVRIANSGPTPVAIHEFISLVSPDFGGDEGTHWVDPQREHPPLPHTLKEGDVAVFRTTNRLAKPAGLDELDYSGDCFVFVRLTPDGERYVYRKHMYFVCVEGSGEEK